MFKRGDKMAIEPIKPLREREDSSRLDELLQSLLGLCEEAGAHACAVIECGDLSFVDRSSILQDIPVEERSIFWPVPRFPKDSIEDTVRLYGKAVVFGIHLENEGSRIEVLKKIYDIAGRVESACFYAGCYLAIGLAAGNCREVFCGDEKKCQALTVGKACKYPLKSRPCIEACGLDLEAIAARAGWDDFEPDAFLMGMVFVA